MSHWPAAKARRVLAALLRLGWAVKREESSHKTLAREGWPDVVFAFHDGEEIGRGCSRAWRSVRACAPRICSTQASGLRKRRCAPQRLHPAAAEIGH